MHHQQILQKEYGNVPTPIYLILFFRLFDVDLLGLIRLQFLLDQVLIPLPV